MSLHTFTIDSLMQLNQNQLQYALRVFDEELAGTLALLASNPDTHRDEVVLDDLSNLLTLRKVFRQRIEELATEQGSEATEQGRELLLISANALETAA